MAMMQEKDGEALLESLRRSNGDAERMLERQAEWEKSHPIAVRTIVATHSYRFLPWWDNIIVGCTMASLMFTPLDAALNMSDTWRSWYVALLTIECLFAANVLLTLRRAYLWQETVLIKEPLQILRRYVCSGWIFVDVLSACPFTVLLDGSSVSMPCPRSTNSTHP